jgi:hypothetical protein
MQNDTHSRTYILDHQVSPQLQKFHKAVDKNDLKTVATLAQQYPELVNTIIEPLYESALSFIILGDNIYYQTLELLLKYRIDLNSPIGIDKQTALEIACKKRDLKLCSFLINNKVNITSLTPHYLLFLSTSSELINIKNFKIIYYIIKLLGGLNNVAAMLNDAKQSFQECATTETKLYNAFGGSFEYNFWNLLKLTEKLELEENLKTHSQEIKSMIAQSLLQPLSIIIMQYYLNSEKCELTLALKEITTDFSKQTILDAQSCSVFNMNLKHNREYNVTGHAVERSLFPLPV